ncbi:MAG: aldo/keto reductase, partial [Comamonadaceae bacterium]
EVIAGRAICQARATCPGVAPCLRATASRASRMRRPRGTGTTRKYLNPRGLRILDALDAVARRHGATPGQVALAWQMARPAITSPIASATSVEQLDQLVAATRLRLDAADVQQLDLASEESQDR